MQALQRSNNARSAQEKGDPRVAFVIPGRFRANAERPRIVVQRARRREAITPNRPRPASSKPSEAGSGTEVTVTPPMEAP